MDQTLSYTQDTNPKKDYTPIPRITTMTTTLINYAEQGKLAEV